MSVSISLVRTVVAAVTRAGHPVDVLLRAAKLERTVLDDPNARIDVASYDALQERALELTGDAALGLHMGDDSSVAAFQTVGHLASHCRTLREGLEVFFRYHRIVADCPPSYLVERERAGQREAVLVYNFLRTTPRCTRLRAEFGVTRLVRIAQLLLGPSATPHELCFEHAAPEDAHHLAEYTRVLGSIPILFAQAQTAIVMSAALLDTEQRHPNPDLFRVLKLHADKQLFALAQDATHAKPLARKIHGLIVHHFSELEPDMDSIARRLGTSARSLRRHLQAEGSSFSELVDVAMGELACNILREPNTTIQEAAFRLGFAEVSSFHRAFKRWTGQTPKQFRQ